MFSLNNNILTPGLPFSQASKRPQPSTPAAAEPSKKASKGENGSKQVATPASAAPAKHAASSAAATPESKEGGRKDKKEKKSAGEKAVVAAAAGGPTPVKGESLVCGTEYRQGSLHKQFGFGERKQQKSANRL